jgi:hypothetical protein
MVENFQDDLRHTCDNDECAILHKRNRRRGFRVLCLKGTQIGKREGSASRRMLQVSLNSTYATSVKVLTMCNVLTGYGGFSEVARAA